MGNCFGVVHVDSHDKKDIEVFDSIFLRKGNVADLFNVFNEVDVDGSGEISYTEFLVTYRLESTPLIDLIFDSFNVKSLNFLEFACLIWNFLSLDQTRLSYFMFFICNVAKKTVIPFTQMEKCYRLIHGNFKGNMKLISPLSAMQARCGDTGITINQFVEFCDQYPIICHPLIMVHFHFRDKIIGQNFWTTLCEKRHRHDAKHLLDPRFVFDLVASRRQELAIMNSLRSKGVTSFARRMSVRLTGQNAEGGTKKSTSTRKKQTKIGNAARRLSTSLLNTNHNQVSTVVSKPSANKKQTNGTKKKTGPIEYRYGYAQGDPDNDPDDVDHKAHPTVDNESNLDSTNTTPPITPKGEVNTSKKTPKVKSKQIHPDDKVDHDNKSGSKKKNAGNNTSNITGAVRRLSVSIANVAKRGKKKDRSKQFASSS